MRLHFGMIDEERHDVPAPPSARGVRTGPDTARRAMYPRHPRRGASERAPARPGARCTRAASARGVRTGPDTRAPTLVGARVPRARPAPRSAVGHPAHGAGRRRRRPLPLGCRTPRARGGPPRTSAPTTVPPSARGVRTGPDTALRAMYPRRLGAGRPNGPAEDVGPYHRSAVGHPAHGAGRRGRRPLPPLGCRTPRARGGPPRTSAPTTARLSDNPRTGRAAEDVGPYHSAGGQPATGAARGTVGRFFAIIPA